VRPYFEQDGIAIYHGDCLDVLPALGALEASMVLADPNYGETKLDWDKLDFGWLSAVDGAAALNASLWCWGSFRMFLAVGHMFGDCGWRLAQDVVWEKHNGSGFAADRFKRVHELAAQFYRKRAAWADVYKARVTTPDAVPRQVRRKRRPPHMGNVEKGHYVSLDGGPRLQRSVIYARSCHGYADLTGQKPIAVVRPLIEHSCPPGELVIDPMMGSGTTLVVAKSLGRRAVGIDRSEARCEGAAKRLVQEMGFEAAQ